MKGDTGYGGYNVKGMCTSDSVMGGRKAEEMGVKGKPWLFGEVSPCVMCIDKSVLRSTLFSV